MYEVRNIYTGEVLSRFWRLVDAARCAKRNSYCWQVMPISR